MKKILFILLSTVTMASSYAVNSTSSNLSLAATVGASCSTGLTSSSLNFTLIPGQTPSAGSTNLNITCVNGTVISAMTAASSNGWQLKGSATGFNIPYTLNTDAHGVMFGIQWSGAAGSTAPVNLLSTTSLVVGSAGVGSPSGSQTMNLSGTNGSNTIPITMNVVFGKIANNAPVDIYSDTVVISTNY